MGKGRILQAHGEGRYTIEITEDRVRAETSRALAVSRVTDLDARIAERETELAEAQAEVDAAADALDQAINDYQAEIQAEGESDIDTAEHAVALQEAAAKRDGIAGNIRALKVGRLAAQRRIDLIDALPPLRQIEAWCADYTEDLAGDVATAEVPGEVGQVIIEPGFSDGAAWSASEDGALQPALSGTPAGVFYNLAMLPGWQKWRPTFRIATISNIDNDLCDITLDPATSSQQGLDVNAEASYSGVPIMYMDCNGAAFEDGDRVLVAFSGNTEQPMVVGFEKEPRECGVNYILIRTQIYIRAKSLPLDTTSSGSYPPKPGTGYDRDERSENPRPWILQGVFDVDGSQIKIFGYSRQDQIDPIKDLSYEETNSFLTQYDVLENQFQSELESATTPRVGTSTILQLVPVDGLSFDVSNYGFSHAGTGFWFKDWWIEHEQESISESEIALTVTDRGAADAALFDNGVDGSGDPVGKLWYSNALGTEPAVRFDINVTLDNFYDSIEYDGDTYYPERLVTYKHGSPSSGVMHVYAEFKRSPPDPL